MTNKPTSAIEQLRHLVFDIQPDDHDEAKYQLTVIRTLIEACWQLDARNKELSDKLELESRAKGKLFEYIAEHKKRLDALAERLDNITTAEGNRKLEDWLSELLCKFEAARKKESAPTKKEE
jgi:hypothetical protein